MGNDIRIAFGLRLTKVALSAKGGRLTSRDRINLLADTLCSFRHDDVVCEAILHFNRDCQIDQIAAGTDLLDFIEIYCGPERFERAVTTETALATYESADLLKYDWQKRVDING